MKLLFQFALPVCLVGMLLSSCQQQSYSAIGGVSNRRAKANVRYYKHQNEGLRLSSAATKYNVNYKNYQKEGLKLSSQEFRY